MKKIPLFVLVLLGGLAAYNTRLEASKDCACEPECWCKKPVLRHYRWVAPFSHKISARIDE